MIYQLLVVAVVVSIVAVGAAYFINGGSFWPKKDKDKTEGSDAGGNDGSSTVEPSPYDPGTGEGEDNK